MGTAIIVLLIIINVFKIGYMHPCKAGISVKSCLPDDYREVLHLCSNFDGACHGSLSITAIPFWHRRFRGTNITVMMTDTSKENVIYITTNSSFGGCTQLHTRCSIVSTNSNKLFWFSSGNGEVITYIRGINYGFQYTLKITCQDKRNLKIFSWLLYRSFYVRVRFISRHISHAEPDEVSPITHLQTAAAIQDSDLRKASGISTNFIPRTASMGRSTSKDQFPKRMKRKVSRQCRGMPGMRRKKRCGGGLGSATTTQMSTESTLMTIAASHTYGTSIPSTSMMNKNTTLLTTATTTGTTLSTTPTTTATTLATPSKSRMTTSTTQTTATTSTVSSTTLKTTNTAPLNTGNPSSTTPSTTIYTPFTRLTTTTNTPPSITSSTPMSTLPTMRSTIPLTSLSYSSTYIIQSNVPTSTSTNYMIESSKTSTTKMTTSAIRTPPSSTESTISAQPSLGTAPATTTTSQQKTTAATYKSSKSSKMTTISPFLETDVSLTMKETTPVYETPTATNFILNSSSKMTSAANTVYTNTAIRQSTTSPVTTKAITSKVAPVTLLVTSTPRVLTTTGFSIAATSPTEPTVALNGTTISLPDAEHVSSHAFVDDPLNVALVSILAGLTAIGSTVGIVSYIRSKIAGTQNNRSDSIADENTSTSSGSSTEDKSRYSGSSSSSNILISSTASKSPLLTPVETV